MSVGVGKPPRKLRGAEDVVCKYYASTGQRFLLSKPVSVSVNDTRRADSGAAWSEARALPLRRLISLARRPPATPTPHSAPQPHHAPPPPLRSCTAPAASARRAPAQHNMHRTYAKFHNCSNSARCRKSTTFHSLKRRGNKLRNAHPAAQIREQ
ncbi:hypothetical protein O0L34_g759 [Tuta absoluta]|nr:hypothetical protein O0L34_g759 [Tuta absoluta]